MPLVSPYQKCVLSGGMAHLSKISVLAEYLFRINGHTPSAWELKGTAVAGYTVAVLRKYPFIFGSSGYLQ